MNLCFIAIFNASAFICKIFFVASNVYWVVGVKFCPFHTTFVDCFRKSNLLSIIDIAEWKQDLEQDFFAA
jgi:hypothetical protein